MSSQNLVSDDPRQGLSEFFHTIWKDTEGFVYLPTLDRKTNAFRKVMFAWPKDERSVTEHVLSGAARGLDVYYSPALYKEVGAATKDNVLGTHVIWSEFDDGSAPNEWLDLSESAPEASAAGSVAHRAAQRRIPPPSVRVQSSLDGNEHVYWALDEFATDLKWIEEKNKSITYTLRADTSGWDVTQILRPPFSLNYKRNEPLPVTVVNIGEQSYASASFSHLKAPAQIVNDSISVEDLPNPERIVAKYEWDDTHFDLFMDSNLPEGQRSSALMRLGYFCAEVGMSDSEAYSILLNADDRWGKYKGRADRKRRLVDIIERARQKHPRTDGLTFASLNRAGDSKPAVEGLSLSYGFADFLASSIEVEWVVEDLIEKGGMGMISAAPGVGKTQLSIQLAICLALDRPFIGWVINKPRRVALLSLEMGHVGLKKFMTTIAGHYTSDEHAILQDRFKIHPIGERVPLDKPEGMQFIFSLLDEFKPEAIVIDAMSKLSIGDLDEKTSRLLNDKFKEIRDRYECVLWIIHHNRKANGDNKKPTQLSDVYGNQYLTADMSAVLVAWHDDKMPKGYVEIVNVKNRFAEERDSFTVRRDEHLYFTIDTPEETQGMVDNLTKVMHKGDGYKNQEASNQSENARSDLFDLG